MRNIMMLVALLATAACATVRKPAALTQAEALDQVLNEQGADRRAEAAMIRSREALAAAASQVAGAKRRRARRSGPFRGRPPVLAIRP